MLLNSTAFFGFAAVFVTPRDAEKFEGRRESLKMGHPSLAGSTPKPTPRRTGIVAILRIFALLLVYLKQFKRAIGFLATRPKNGPYFARDHAN